MVNVLFLLILLSSVPRETPVIYYNEHPKLTWDDFKKVKQMDDAKAMTSTAISYDYDSEKGVKVYCVLYSDASYVQTKSMSIYLLNHEQRHFDLTYIYAKKLASKLKLIPNPTENFIKKLYDQTIKEWDIEQDRYDSETDHSISEEKQVGWDFKIDNLLKNL